MSEENFLDDLEAVDKSTVESDVVEDEEDEEDVEDVEDVDDEVIDEDVEVKVTTKAKPVTNNVSLLECNRMQLESWKHQQKVEQRTKELYSKAEEVVKAEEEKERKKEK